MNIKSKIGNIEDTIQAFVVDNKNFCYDILLGLDSIKKFRLIQGENLEIFQKTEKQISTIDKDEENSKDFDCMVNFNENVDVSKFMANLDHLEEEKQILILELMKKYDSIFARNKYDIGRVQNHEAQIKLLENKYISKKPYRCSGPDQLEIEHQIAELLKADLIEESSSPFAAPVTLAFKREDGKKTRLCVDFRELNKLVVPEAQPFPLIDDIILKTRNCHWFTALDINSAFWSIPVREKDRSKTAFVTQQGHWQWKCLPFGLKISPAIFQRILNNIVRKNNLNSFCINYIDDILIFSETFEEHLIHLGKLLQAIYDEGFRLKLLKCDFAKNSIKYLGHLIKNNQVMPMKDYLVSIREFPIPKTKKNVRQFLGKINFYHKYIKNSARILEPLHSLLRKDSVFIWNDHCEKAFQEIKNYLCSAPILTIFDKNLPIFIYTDASIEGIGAVLKQRQENGEILPVAYFSKKLNTSQKRKKAIYLECLAIKEAIRYWQYWLIGSKFTVFSDHKPLENLNIRSRTDEELGDMVYYLSQYDFDIKYSPGSENLEADCLSRNAVLSPSDEFDEILKVVNMIEKKDIEKDQKNIEDVIKIEKKIIKRKDIFYKQLRGVERIFVSEELEKLLVDKIHRFYGHIGGHQIALKIRPFYYFKNMDQIIKNYCRICDTCLRNKSRREQKYGVLSQLGPATKPFQIVSLDTIGGFGGRRSTKKYLHLLVDHFTRFAFIHTSKNQTSLDFIRLLEKVSDHKIDLLLTDQYSGINSTEFKNYLTQRHIEIVFTAVNCPFSNGLNERLNQTLVNRIRCKINEESKRRAWSTIARECVDEYNKTVHTVNKFSPEYLLFGIDSPIIPEELREEKNLETDRSIALQNSNKYHKKNKLRIDKNRKVANFKEGDFVYIENSNKLNRKKLDEIRCGPYRIKKIISDSIVEINCDHKKQESNLYHVTKLLPCSNDVFS